MLRNRKQNKNVVDNSDIIRYRYFKLSELALSNQIVVKL
jgi:hypothetical protein